MDTIEYLDDGESYLYVADNGNSFVCKYQDGYIHYQNMDTNTDKALYIASHKNIKSMVRYDPFKLHISIDPVNYHKLENKLLGFLANATLAKIIPGFKVLDFDRLNSSAGIHPRNQFWHCTVYLHKKFNPENGNLVVNVLKNIEALLKKYNVPMGDIEGQLTICDLRISSHIAFRATDTFTSKIPRYYFPYPGYSTMKDIHLLKKAGEESAYYKYFILAFNQELKSTVPSTGALLATQIGKGNSPISAVAKDTQIHTATVVPTNDNKSSFCNLM